MEEGGAVLLSNLSENLEQLIKLLNSVPQPANPVQDMDTSSAANLTKSVHIDYKTSYDQH